MTPSQLTFATGDVVFGGAGHRIRTGAGLAGGYLGTPGRLGRLAIGVRQAESAVRIELFNTACRCQVIRLRLWRPV